MPPHNASLRLLSDHGWLEHDVKRKPRVQRIRRAMVALGGTWKNTFNPCKLFDRCVKQTRWQQDDLSQPFCRYVGVAIFLQTFFCAKSAKLRWATFTNTKHQQPLLSTLPQSSCPVSNRTPGSVARRGWVSLSTAQLDSVVSGHLWRLQKECFGRA